MRRTGQSISGWFAEASVDARFARYAGEPDTEDLISFGHCLSDLGYRPPCPGRAIIFRRWIIWTSILGCFTAGYSVMAGTVHLLHFYPLMIVNLGLLTLVGSLWLSPSTPVLPAGRVAG